MPAQQAADRKRTSAERELQARALLRCGRFVRAELPVGPQPVLCCAVGALRAELLILHVPLRAGAALTLFHGSCVLLVEQGGSVGGRVSLAPNRLLLLIAARAVLCCAASVQARLRVFARYLPQEQWEALAEGMAVGGGTLRVFILFALFCTHL